MSIYSTYLYQVLNIPVVAHEAIFIVVQGMIKGKGLQALVQILYQILDKTRNVVL